MPGGKGLGKQLRPPPQQDDEDSDDDSDDSDDAPETQPAGNVTVVRQSGGKQLRPSGGKQLRMP